MKVSIKAKKSVVIEMSYEKAFEIVEALDFIRNTYTDDPVLEELLTLLLQAVERRSPGGKT